MRCIFGLPDITKIAHFWWKITDVSRSQGVSRVIYVFPGTHQFRIYVTDFKDEAGFLSPPHPWAAPKRPIILNKFKVLYSLFWLYANLRAIKIYCRSLSFTLYNAFSEKKKISGTSPLALFSAWFLQKNISLVIFY